MVVSSGDLVQRFEATWDLFQWRAHRDAEVHTRAAYARAWGLICERTVDGGSVGEAEVQAAILDHFNEFGLTTYSPPIVAVGPHSGDPHYEPTPEHDAPIPYMQRIRDYYQGLGYGAPYRWAHYAEVPFQSLAKPLAECRVALITTAAPYQPGKGSPTGRSRASG